MYREAGEIALIRSQNVYNEGFRRDGLAYISQEHADQLSNVAVQQGDVLLNITGDSVARCCQVDPEVLPARVNQHVAIIRTDGTTLSTRYLRYYMVSPQMQEMMLSWAGSGGTRNALTKGMIEGFEIPAPKDLREQQAIACILGALDDKIELNRRMNRTLEAMARAIFKSWFVDFDPVRAKGVGADLRVRPEHGQTHRSAPTSNTPEWPEHIFDLFPDSFQESELGEIPKGWRVQSLAELVEVIGGGTPKTSVPEYWNGQIPWFSVVDTPQPGEVFVIQTEKSITEAGVVNSSTKILPVGTTIISARGTVGNLALVGVPMAMNQSCYGLRGRRDGFGYFVYFTTAAAVETLRQRTHGSVFNTITRDTLQSVRVVVPLVNAVAGFEGCINPIFQRVLCNLLQSRTLAYLRDALLPKLISGELRVRDAERIVGRCA